MTTRAERIIAEARRRIEWDIGADPATLRVARLISDLSVGAIPGDLLIRGLEELAASSDSPEVREAAMVFLRVD